MFRFFPKRHSQTCQDKEDCFVPWHLSPSHGTTTFSSLLLLLPVGRPQEEEHLVPLTAKAQRQQRQQTAKTSSFSYPLWAANSSRDRVRQLPCTATAAPQPLARLAGHPHPQWAREAADIAAPETKKKEDWQVCSSQNLIQGEHIRD